MQTVLWIVGVIVFIAGVAALLRRQVLWGIILMVVGMAIGGFGFL